MIFQDNITFAIIAADSGWRNDLTIRFSEYFSRALNGENHAQRVVMVDSADEALEKCETDYLIIQFPGSIIFNEDFFYKTSSFFEKEQQLFLGELRVDYDYAHINDTLVIFNIPLWKQNEKIFFKSQVRSGPRFKIVKDNLEDKNSPLKLDVDGDDTIYIPNECSISGAGIVAKQLTAFKSVTSLLDVVSRESFFFLSRKTPYSEVHTETIFEKKYLNRYFNAVPVSHSDNLLDTKETTAEIVVAPAISLKPMMLARHFKAKKLVVYSKSEIALEFQRILLLRKSSCLYAEAVEDFKKKFPGVELNGSIESLKNDAVVPINIDIEFHLVDPLSFEMEDFLRSIDDVPSALFDISDIFISPYYFYKRPLYQVQAFYAQLNSLMAQRRGPTHIMGIAPGNVLMNMLDINTSTLAYTWVPKPKPEVDPDAEPIEEEVEVTPAMIQQQNAPWVYNPEKPIEDKPIPMGFIQGIKAKLTEWIAEDKKEEKKNPPPAIVPPAPRQPEPPPRRVVPELMAPPVKEKVEPLIEVHHKQEQPPVIFVPKNALEEAIHQGYAKARRIDNNISYTVLTKQHQFDTFLAVFEYSINQLNNSWTFKVKRDSGSRWVTFSTGVSDEDMLKHLQLPLKINPKTALKFL